MKWIANGLKSCPLCAIAIALVLAGCGGDDPPTNPGSQEEPPELPDASTLSIDLAAFSGASAKWEIQPQAPSDSSSYLTAKATVGVISLALVVIAAPASAAFEGAFGAEPLRQSDGSWTWSYSVAYGDKVFDLALNGKAAPQQSEWSMRVTTTGFGSNLTNFLWYSGVVAASGDEGYWQLYDPTIPAAPTNALRVNWEATSADDRSAVWLNNRAEADGEGDLLSFEQSGVAASVEFADASNGTVSTIEWDVMTTAGSITIPFYNQGTKSCWDSSHLNASCAP